MANIDSEKKSLGFFFSLYTCQNILAIFPVVMYGCESWTVKKAERRRIDAFELWCGEDS